jgi:hypothetical protein
MGQVRRRTRAWAAIGVLLGFFAVASWLLLRASPSEFVAGALGALLGRRVEVASVELHAGGSLEIEIRDLQIFEDGVTEPAASVTRVVARLRWPRLLAGQLLPTVWALEGPVLRLVPPGVDGGAPDFPLLRPMEVTVRDGTLVLGDPGDGSVELRNVQITARSAPLTQAVRGTALGQASVSGRTLASFSVEFDGSTDGIEARGSVSGFELGGLPIPGLPPIGGSASGTVAGRWTPAGREGSVDLDVSELIIDHPSLSGPIAPQQAHIAAEIRQAESGIQVRLSPLRLDDLSIQGTIGFDEDSRVRARLTADPFRAGVADGRLQLIRLLGLRFKTWANADRRSEGGRVEGLSFRLDVPNELLMETLAFNRKTRSRELEIEARVRNGVYRHNPLSAPLEDIHAVVHIRGNRLEVYDLSMTREGRPLPEIDLTLDGLDRFCHLPPAERRMPAGPGRPIPGLGSAFAALSEGPPDREKSPLLISNASVGYPAFLLPIREANATLSVENGDLLVENLEGIVGGAPAQAQALWSPSENRVLVQLSYLEGEVPTRELPDAPWIQGTFGLKHAYLGPWHLENVQGEFAGFGSELALPRIEGELAGGRIRLDGSLELGKSGRAPVALELDLQEADAERIGRTLSLEPETLSGELGATGKIEGPLRPKTPFLKEGRVDLKATVKNGTLGNLPVTVTLARLATPLGWTGLFGRALPVETLETSLRIQEGVLHVEDFELVGPELRMLSAGRVRLLDEGRPVDLWVALLLFQPVDRVLENVPVIGDWMLGKDRSLVGLYFRLEGPWGSPEGSYVPPQTLRTATGWAERIIVGGVRTLRDLVVGGGGAKP